MNRKSVIGLVVATILVVGAAAVVIASGGAAAVERCCSTNPRFSGLCSATLAEGETCSSVLGYLNNPNSTGKAYCGGTPVRGGWQKVTCEQ